MTVRAKYRVFVFLLAFAHLGAYLTTANGGSPWFVWMVTAVTLGWSGSTYALRRMRRRQTRRSNWAPITAVALLVTGSSLVLGMLDGFHTRMNIDGDLYQPVTIQATVSSSHAIRNGWSAVLIIRSIQPNSPDTAQSAYAKAEWVHFGQNPPLSDMTPGTRFVATGTLSRPPIADAKGKPIRSMLASSGIHYSWTGRIQSLRPAAHPWTTRVRTILQSSLLTIDPGRSSVQALMLSILFGGQTPDAATNQAFLAAGLLHVLAASGANVVLLMKWIEWTFQFVGRIIRIPIFVSTGFILGAIWFFCLLCGSAPSILRASMMASYQRVGHAVGRSPSCWESMLFSLLVMSWIQPASMSGTSSVLSFVATMAVAVAVESRRRLQPGVQSRMLQALSHIISVVRVTLWVEVLIFPVGMLYFGQITPYAVVSNLLAEPLLSVLLPICALYVTLGAVAIHVHMMVQPCRWVGWLAAWPLWALLKWVHTISTWPGAILAVPKWPWFVMILYYCAWFVAILVWPKRRQWKLCYNRIELYVTIFTKCIRRLTRGDNRLFSRQGE